MSGVVSLATVRAVIRDISPGQEVGDDTPLIAERIIDSLTLLKVVARLERDFGIHVGDRDIDPRNFESVRAIAAFIESKDR
ncbi:hypothetical protein AVR91_0220680 [Amycolatopsis keratiniphila subsp. keratiniphila]|uniref:Carrier domain-containing protein n=1 Tax=Amycolatopsis keratiniphila subsp. keratiniphila TaxID=227715 RepID=A0A1W2LT74_9PSEU|nr:hypothetical protein AVR91_0220680 [Amycolatopsis keratiniphila subsp. keratiniphila]